MKIKAKRLLKSVLAVISCGTIAASSSVLNINAYVLDTENPNNYDNFAQALQLALCFYDANKCGDEVADDGYYSWRGNCHVKDANIPLVHMETGGSSGKASEDSGKGDGGASAAEGLYVGTNMSDEFIKENIEYLDPDGDGCVNLTGGWHDAGDHVKFGLPGSYSASTVGWGYYEFRDSYIETGLQKHVEDELRWINDYFLKATFLDENDKVVAYCYQVGEGNNDHNYWCAPELQVDGTFVASSSCAVKRPAYFATTETPASDQCAGASASLAINYLNFKDTDPEYAEECLKYALALYDFAVETHADLGDKSLTVTSLGYDGGFYTSSYDYDELAWAAVWLYYCTENYDYIDDIISVDETVTGEMGAHPYTGYMRRIISDTGNCWQNIWVHCWDTIWGGVFAKLAPITNISRDWYIFRWNLEYWSGMTPADAAEAEFDVPVTAHKYFGQDDVIWNTKITAKEIADLPETDGAWLAKTPAGFAMLNDYGSARYNTAAGMCAMVYAKETGDMTFAEWAKGQMEYILGDNPMGYAYEVGYENSYATFPHHRAAHCSPTQAMDNPETYQVHTLYGALVGGPDAKDYHHDETKDYIYNEVTDDYNAAFTGALAGLYHYYGAEGKELADKNYIIEDFNMSENKPGAKDDSLGIYVTAGKAQETDAGLQVKLVIHNETTNPPKFESDMRVRYYFNISEQLEAGEDISFIETRIDYDQEKSFTDGKNEAHISEPVKYDDNGTYYIEISWINCDFYGSRVYQFGLLNKMNPETFDTVWDSTNDYSYSDLISFEDDNDAAALTDKVTAYVDGELIWGVEPDGTTPKTTDNTEDKTLYGDANCDGNVDISDAVLIKCFLINSKKYSLSAQGKKNADVQGNGNGINAQDAVAIQKYILKQIKALPVK
ncbi:MAG: glycoside hydrolase family 9 protein [Ruminococcus sp.]|nr:glycoside hydrolase family 9 protein [Ruminococcus sp.]